jgi:predicted enzyme related to lactoylglutathione lyase
MKKVNPVVHFEMPAEDMNRMTSFYSKVFGWQTQIMGEEMGNYVVVTTSETDENGRPKMAGTINGGFYLKQNGQPANHPSVVIAVDDIKLAVENVKKAGGKIINETTKIPGVGLYVSIFDTEGNLVSLLQPEMK